MACVEPYGMFSEEESDYDDDAFMMSDDEENVAPPAATASKKKGSKKPASSKKPLSTLTSNKILVNKKKGGNKSVEEIYQKKSQLEHILLRPDTYIGSVERLSQGMWILDKETNRIKNKEISYTPGLFKIFDESKSFNMSKNARQTHF
jgi:DNA topoisomerase-2